MPYYYALEAVPSVIERLNTDNFREKCILNFSLIDAMLAQGGWEVYVDLFLHTASKDFDFLTAYAKREDGKPDFFIRLFTLWTDAVLDISKYGDEEKRNILWREFFKVMPLDNVLTDTERNIISGLYSFINSNISAFNTGDLLAYLRTQHVIFKEIVAPYDKSEEFYKGVLNASLFEITNDNLEVIFGEKYNKQSLTSIMDGESEVSDYLCHDVNKLLDIFPDTDTEEAPKATTWLVNQKNVDDEKLERYLDRQTKGLSPDGIVVKDRILLTYKLNVIIPTWDNVHKYFCTQDDATVITGFITRNKDVLSTQQYEVADNGDMERFLFADNTTLAFEDYCSLINCFKTTFNESDLPESLTTDRGMVLVDHNLIPYSIQLLKRFQTQSLELFIKYLVKNYDEYVKTEGCGLKWTNKMQIDFLNSHATLEQKVDFLDKEVVISDDDDAIELARLVCYYYNKADDLKNADLSLISRALIFYKEENSWQVKISLVNRVHSCRTYDKELTIQYLDGLGGGYVELNKIGAMVSWFDNNDENKILLSYLRDKGHCVSKFREVDGRLKVTHKRK